MTTTSEVSKKHYTCKECGYDKEIETNHYGQVYSLGKYMNCPDFGPTTWCCQTPIPEGMQLPEDWTDLNWE